MKTKPFIFEKTGIHVTSAEAAELVQADGADCHDFAVNPVHESPNLQTLRTMMEDFRLTSSDGDSFILYNAIEQALIAAEKGRYGVGSVLATTRSHSIGILERAMNEREKGGKYEFTGHAEMRLVDQATPYLQKNIDHSHDVAGVNLCPCPGCFSHMIDAHIRRVVVGSIDPKVGAAFLKEEKLRYAIGEPRTQVIADRKLVYEFPNIPDEQLRADLLSISWEVFHTTRKKVHSTMHNGLLKE